MRTENIDKVIDAIANLIQAQCEKIKVWDCIDSADVPDAPSLADLTIALAELIKARWRLDEEERGQE